MTKQFINLKKIKGLLALRNALRHNLREINRELTTSGRIDPLRTSQNQILHGLNDSRKIMEQVAALMTERGAKLRKDGISALEILVSLPPSTPPDEQTSFFSEAATWAQNFYEGIPLLSAVIHRDESTPHCHILLLPLVGNCMNGSRLAGAYGKVETLHRRFHAEVGQKYGLALSGVRLVPKITRETANRYASAAIAKLLESPDAIRLPEVTAALRHTITHDPLPLVTALNIPVIVGLTKMDVIVNTMTKPIKANLH